MTPSLVFSTTWTVWACSWILAAPWSASDSERQPWRSAWVPYALIVTSIVLPILWHASGLPNPRFWVLGWSTAYGFAVATIPGFVFAWWARLHLGRLWSAAITRKADHRLIDTGPYAYVRHPIYTGILASALVTDAASATLPAALSLAALWSGFWLKARAEEGFLSVRLEPGVYAAYRARVPMLVPFATPADGDSSIGPGSV